VVRHGTLVFEHYFSGADEHWGRSVGEVAFDPDIKHDERSVTKSIVALVLGIAIDRGLIKSLDEPVLSFFPDYADLRTPEKDKITLRDLVTMSGGLEWHEDDTPYTSEANSENRMDNAADPYRYALQQAVVAPPGQVWNYNSGSTELIGAVLKKATGKSVDELAGSLLFAPLGITDVEWPRNARGDPIAAGSLRLRPRDLAKIGQLVLQHGAWNGAQVVPAPWIEAATAPQINVSGFTSFFYGYFFWLGRSLADKSEVQWSAAVGLGGQRVFIVPSLDLVVVVNAGLYSSRLQSSVPMTILNQYVLKATAFRP
jgi:CubicO group peptidase (beta-lactamase class C family)